MINSAWEKEELQFMATTIFTAIATFISTNIDDIFLLMFLFAQTDARKDKWSIVIGQYLGSSILLALSILGASGLSLIMEENARLLGVFPILIAFKTIMEDKYGKKNEEDAKDKSSFLLTTAGLAIANGGDNLGILIPLFAQYKAKEITITVIIFMLLMGLWCFFGYKAACWPALRDFIRKYRTITVFTVLAVIGFWILFSL